MTEGSRVICRADVYPAGVQGVSAVRLVIRENSSMAEDGQNLETDWARARLRKHADYQRVYKAARKHFSPSVSYFFRLRDPKELVPCYLGPRVGLTTGRVLGKAVERNRIKRRMRAAARASITLLPPLADVVLHPRRVVLDMEFRKLEGEVAQIFSSVSVQAAKTSSRKTGSQA
jgi:ribonuclease P protein component